MCKINSNPVVRFLSNLLNRTKPARKRTPRTRLALELLEDRAVPAVLTVNSLLDGPVNFNDDVVTLREAVQAANNDVQVSTNGQTGSGADTIQFANGLRGGTITLTQGELRVTESLTIQGLGAGNLTISGGNTTRLFVLGGNGANEYNFNDVTLADGNGQGTNERRGGGAIQMFADRDDVLNINRSVLRNHQTNNRVGAAVSLVFGTINVTDSSIVNNGSGQGTIYLQDSTGIITSSTLSGNQSSFGSVWARSGFGTANLTLTNATVANNNVGIFYSSERVNAATNVSYRNSIFSGNGASFQIGGATGTITLTSQGNNILSDATGDATPQNTDRLNTDARISPLTEVNGQFIHQLLPGSVAIDAADGNAPASDQIGIARRDGDLNGSVIADIGAAESTAFLVTTAQDLVNANDGLLSLREAVTLANAAGGADTIFFGTNLSGGTITLTQGELRVTESLTIQGLGAGNLTISGGNTTRLFVLGGNGANVYNFNDITLADGNGQGANERRGGGAIQLFADRDDVLNINRSVLRNHQTNNRVGAAVSLVFGTINVTDSAIVNNGSGQGTIYLQDSTGNITNSTLSGNQSSFGLVWARSGFGTANLTLTNATVANNNVGIFYSSERVNAATNVSYRNSIFSGNGASYQIGGATGTITLTSQGNNILSDATGDATPQNTDRLNTDARLTPLTQVNGTFVHRLLPGSVAIDAANNAFAPAQDQRGQARVDGEGNGTITPDIGAFEFTNVAPVLNAQTFSINENQTFVGIVLATDADLPNDTLTFRIAGNGPDDSLFTISANGDLAFRSAPDFENPTDRGGADNNNVYQVAVVVQDGTGATSQALITVNVNNVNDDLPVVGAATVDALFSVIDNLATRPPTFGGGFGNAALAQFFRTDDVLDSAANPFSSSDGRRSVVDTVFGGFDRIENYSGPAVQRVEVRENTTHVQTLVADVVGLPDQPATFSIRGGDDARHFRIRNGRELVFVNAPDYENPADANGDNVYEVEIEIDMGHGMTMRQVLRVTVTPVNDNAPQITSPAVVNVSERNTIVQTLTATDGDLPAQDVSFRITGAGADDNQFTITNGNQLRFRAAPAVNRPCDANRDNVYEVEIEANDGQGRTSRQILRVIVSGAAVVPFVTAPMRWNRQRRQAQVTGNR